MMSMGHIPDLLTEDQHWQATLPVTAQFVFLFSNSIMITLTASWSYHLISSGSTRSSWGLF